MFDSLAERSKVEASLQKMNFSMRWGNKTLSDPANWFKPRMLEVVRDPERFKLILESQEERFAFLALPLATLLLCAVFVFQRCFYVFDHTIFALHSLSFQGLLLTTINLTGLAIGGTWGFCSSSPRPTSSFTCAASTGRASSEPCCGWCCWRSARSSDLSFSSSACCWWASTP